VKCRERRKRGCYELLNQTGEGGGGGGRVLIVDWKARGWGGWGGRGRLMALGKRIERFSLDGDSEIVSYYLETGISGSVAAARGLPGCVNPL